MQTMRGCFDGEWDSICKLLSVDEQPDFSSHLLEYFPPATEQARSQEESVTDPSYFSFGNDYQSFLHGSENELGNQFIESYADNQNFNSGCFLDSPASNEISLCFDIPMNGETDGSFGLKFLDLERNEVISMEADYSPNSLDLSTPISKLPLKRKSIKEIMQHETGENSCPLVTPKKKARNSRTPQSKKKSQSKGGEENATTETAEEETEVKQRKNVNCDKTDDDLNESEDSETNKSVITISTGKKRASRGEATDPQSLYARRRRRRINDRLRILQSLVPNGTKVDISTMLEEAFHYVKFLQLQIRLLSSDDLWMYAPLAYNGFDIKMISGCT